MSRWTTRPARCLACLGTALTALVLAHNLAFLVTYGPAYRMALARSGHDAAWTAAVVVVLSVALGLLLAATLQLRRLARLAPPPRRGSPLPGGTRPFTRRLVRVWAALAPATVVLFTIQENLERLAVGDAPPGLAVLARDGSPTILLVIAAVSLAVALVAALFGWSRDLLIARIAAAGRSWRRATASRRPNVVDRRPTFLGGAGPTLRAPPAGLLA
jgi:hypothetical protein